MTEIQTVQQTTELAVERKHMPDHTKLNLTTPLTTDEILAYNACRTGLTARTMGKGKLYNLLLREWEAARIRLQQKGVEDDRELKLIITSLAQRIFEDLPGITEVEIKYAFARGTAGSYASPGDVIYLNEPNVMGWLKGYLEKNRAPVIKKISAYMAPEPAKELTEEEKQQHREAAVLEEFDWFKNMGQVQDAGGTVYDYLQHIGAITLTPKRKWEFFDRAAGKIRKEKQALQEGKTGSARQLIKDQINAILAKQYTGEQKAEIAAEAKRLALADYFQGLIDFDMDIREVLNECKQEP